MTKLEWNAYQLGVRNAMDYSLEYNNPYVAGSNEWRAFRHGFYAYETLVR